jgi:hypothetical protein
MKRARWCNSGNVVTQDGWITRNCGDIDDRNAGIGNHFCCATARQQLPTEVV